MCNHSAILIATMLILGGIMNCNAQSGQPTYRPVSANSHSVDFRDLADGSWEIVTTEHDPYVFLERVSGQPGPDDTVLAFEYACPQGTDNVQVYVFPPLSEANSVKGPGLTLAEGWTSYAIDLEPVLDAMQGKWEGLRLDPGNHAGRTVRIRNIILRPPTERELELKARLEARKQEAADRDARLREYLQGEFPARVSEVRVTADEVVIEADTFDADGPLLLAEVPIWADITRLREVPTLTPIEKPGKFRFTFPRMDGTRDRIYSRWAIVKRDRGQLALFSTGRYPDEIEPEQEMPLERPRGKKGLGGFGPWGDIVSDLDDLGISAVTVNILLNGLIATRPGDGRTPFEFGGRTWYINDGTVAHFDRTFAETSKRGIIVSAIILLAQGHNAPEGDWSHIVAHPDADPAGIFVMPNMDSEEGVLAYAAALDYLVKRYSREDNKYGRIHHFILHNEINAGWVWTNAGEKTDVLYMDLYHRSMRLAHLILRQRDANGKAFISLEHHWNMKGDPHFYTGAGLLDLLNQYCAAEGDFDWALAFHPYPDSLFNPRTWEDKHVTFSLDTPKITFRNLEVLEAWAELKQNWFRGRTQRTVHCTEQGLNSPDYSEKSLREQAAGMAYTWKKLKRLDSIEAFQYHAWLDNRQEFGLRIGLRKFRDEPGDPWGRKPIWYVFEAMGTPREDEVFEQYKSVIGIDDWDEVVHNGPVK